MDETLRLVRGSLVRQNSNGSTTSSNSQRSYGDPLNRPYVNKYASYRATSALVERTHDTNNRESDSRNKLHDRSLRNLSSSRSLFEQQLEQQQQQLHEQQQRNLQDFMHEINYDGNAADFVDGNGDRVESETDSDCSEDSLEGSKDSLEPQSESRNELPQKQQHNIDRNMDKYMNMINNNQNYIRNEQNVPHLELSHTNNLGSNNGYTTANGQYSDRSDKIDSYNVNQVRDVNPVTTKPESRPKVHVRAWATPSPDNGSMSAARVPSTATTKSHPYSVRNTMTSVTTTTAYDQGQTESKHNYVQSNAWTDENTNLKQQYSSNSSQGQSENQARKPPSPRQTQQPAVNNAPYKQYNNLSNAELINLSVGKPPSPQTVVMNTQNGSNRYGAIPNYQKPVANVSKPPVTINSTQISHVSGKNLDVIVSQGENGIQCQSVTASRLPRPVSAVKTTPTSTQATDKSQTQPMIVNNSRPSGETPPVKPPHSSTVSFGYIHGKMAVLPDHPSVHVKQVKGGIVDTYNVPEMKVRDDSEVMRSTNQDDDDEEGVKGILKRPGTGGILKKAGSTGSMNNKQNQLRDSVEIRKGHFLHQEASSGTMVSLLIIENY